MDNKKNRKSVFSKQKTKYGTYTVVLIALVLVGAVVINILASVLTQKLGLRADITDNRLYTISDSTVELLENLEEDIEVTVLTTEYNYQNTSSYRPIREVLMRYEQLSGGKLHVRYVDPYANPDIVEQYSELSAPNEADIIIASSKRYTSIVPSDLYDIRIRDSRRSRSSRAPSCTALPTSCRWRSARADMTRASFRASTRCLPPRTTPSTPSTSPWASCPSGRLC